jgi:argininosuccinate lyase
MTKKPWEGRFEEKTHHSVETFTASIDVDRRLYAYDIQGSIAHCKMLAHIKVLSEEEEALIIQGLAQIKREIDRGEFQFDDSLEDIHMHIEARLLQIAGKAALKLHTARSRNDQVALDVRLYLRDQIKRLLERIHRLRTVLVALAKDHLDTTLPGYTHLQRAQPVLLAHHFMAYYEMLTRDADRFRDGLKRVNIMPLGSAALAGTTYPIDREYAAKLLDFPLLSANSMDAVADRDFIIEFMAAASVCMVHLSRLSEELVLWSSAEFGFIVLPDAFATGSSIMPQKKNPDVPELVRGKTGAVVGNLTAMLVMMKALPLAYNRDMQEDKPLLFSTVDTLGACIDMYIEMLPRLTVVKEKMDRATRSGFLDATDFADYLVGKGVPFRDAHSVVGQAVSFAASQGKELSALSINELTRFSSLIGDDIYDLLSVEQMIARRRCIGGTARENIAAAVSAAGTTLQAETAVTN